MHTHDTWLNLPCLTDTAACFSLAATFLHQTLCFPLLSSTVSGSPSYSRAAFLSKRFHTKLTWPLHFQSKPLVTALIFCATVKIVFCAHNQVTCYESEVQNSLQSFLFQLSPGNGCLAPSVSLIALDSAEAVLCLHKQGILSHRSKHRVQCSQLKLRLQPTRWNTETFTWFVLSRMLSKFVKPKRIPLNQKVSSRKRLCFTWQTAEKKSLKKTCPTEDRAKNTGLWSHWHFIHTFWIMIFCRWRLHIFSWWWKVNKWCKNGVSRYCSLNIFSLSTEVVEWLHYKPVPILCMNKVVFINCLLPFPSTVNKCRVFPQRRSVSLQRCHSTASKFSSLHASHHRSCGFI